MNDFRPFIYLALILVVSNSALAQDREEFSGPLPGWVNVKSRFNAAGDGKKDDTKALQNALDSLSVSTLKFNEGANAYTVLYLPKGKYRITQTLLLKGKIGVMIYGEDPANTSIEWQGQDKDTMMLCNGASYFKITRLGWNANNKKDIECLGIHWMSKWNEATSRSYAPLNIELSDLRFFGNPLVGVGTGTFGYGTGQNDSEITFRRCSFEGAQMAGIKIFGYNALDNWIWSCTFIDCNVAIESSFGNYHANQCKFLRSKATDCLNRNGYYTSVRNSISINSRAFSIDGGMSTNPFKRTFQGNIIQNTATMPVEYYHAGCITLLDNRISLSQDTTAPFMVNQKSWAPVTLQMLSIGNQYGYTKMPLRIPNANKKMYTIGDRGISQTVKPINPNQLIPEKAPPYKKAKVLEIPKGANDEVIQDVVNKAVKMKNSRTIIHFSLGTYKLQKTIVIPAGADLQIIGDGLRYATIIMAGNPDGFQGASLFLVKGPSSVEFRDMQFGVASNKRKLTAILFEKIDQRGASVILDQLYSISDTTLFINKLNFTRFEKNNSFFADGNIIVGGDLQKAGKGTLSVYAFGGQYAGVKVLNNAKFVSQDCWWEGITQIPINLEGDGQITIDGAKIAPNKGDSSTIIRIGKFKGNVSLMNLYIQGGLEIQPNNPSLNLLVWNANYYYKKDINGVIPKNIAGKVAFAGTTSQCFYKDDPECKIIRGYDSKFVNIPDADSFFSEMTVDDRTAIPGQYKSLKKGISNIYLSRVSFDSFNVALQFND